MVTGYFAPLNNKLKMESGFNLGYHAEAFKHFYYI